MEKKLKIQFWKAECALAAVIPEQLGLPLRPHIYDKTTFPWKYKEEYFVIVNKHSYDEHFWLSPTYIELKPKCIEDKKDCWHRIGKITFGSNEARDNYLAKVVKKITDEIFNNPRIEPKVEKNGEVETYIWDIANLIIESE